MAKETKEILKILVGTSKNSLKKFYVKDISNDYHCEFGSIAKSDLNKKQGKVKTNKGIGLSIFDPTFKDIYEKINRGPQIVTLKDIGLIISNTGINKNSVVVDSGSGSGALCCFLAHIAKKVTSYELREDFFNISNQNKSLLKLRNLTIKNKNIYDGIDEKNVDLITFDLPEPWLAITHAEKALNVGGFLVNYSPTIPQVSDFVEGCNKLGSLIHLKTVELIEREWDFDKRKIRPKTTIINHTGFLTFIRKVSG